MEHSMALLSLLNSTSFVPWKPMGCAPISLRAIFCSPHMKSRLFFQFSFQMWFLKPDKRMMGKGQQWGTNTLMIRYSFVLAWTPEKGLLYSAQYYRCCFCFFPRTSQDCSELYPCYYWNMQKLMLTGIPGNFFHLTRNNHSKQEG